MFLSTTDVLVLSPAFSNAVVNVHTALSGIAIVVVFAGFMAIIVAALNEKRIQEIWPALVKIFLVALLLTNLGTLGNFLGDIVTDVEQAAGVNGNPLQSFIGAIQSKFGIDLSTVLGPISPGGQSAISGAQPTTGTKLTSFGYPNDTSFDTNSNVLGIGNHNNQLIPFTGGSQVSSVALTALAASQYNVKVGDTFTANTSIGPLLVRYDDTAPEGDSRLDLYDPNSLLTNGGNDNDFSGSVTSVNNVSAPTNSPGISDYWNAVTHPIETGQVALLGTVSLVLAFVAAFVAWCVGLLQSILFYTSIALGPLFLGFFMVRRLENIAVTFVLGFVSICMWRLAFLVTGLITQLLLSLAVNTSTGSSTTGGVAGAAGLTLLWMIGVSIWVLFSSIMAPWTVSKLIMSGATGVSALLAGAGSTTLHMAQMGAGAATGGISNSVMNTPVSMASASRMNSVSMPNGISKRPPPASNGGSV